MPFYRGNSAVYSGMDGAVTDYLVKWLGLWETVHENFAMADLSPDTRAYVEAYVDGLNFYAATHPDKVDESKLPVTAKDVVVGHMLRHLLFYGFDGVVREVNKAERQRDISTPSEAVVVPADAKEITPWVDCLSALTRSLLRHIFLKKARLDWPSQSSSTHQWSRRL